jgi:hypothetical protein
MMQAAFLEVEALTGGCMHVSARLKLPPPTLEAKC